MQQRQSLKKYAQTQLQAQVLWEVLIYAIRNSVRLDVTKVTWSHLETENYTYHDEDSNYG